MAFSNASAVFSVVCSALELSLHATNAIDKSMNREKNLMIFIISFRLIKEFDHRTNG
jgi:hypothetical protein